MYGFSRPKLVLHICPSCKHTQSCYEGTATHCNSCLQRDLGSIEMITMKEYVRRRAAAGASPKKNYWEA